jgi:prepilin-type N-terminal cleavage/methylation domain-containing protein
MKNTHSQTSLTENEKGFTMIEVLAVTVLVGIASSISVANYNQYKEKVLASIQKRIFHDVRTSFEARNFESIFDLEVDETQYVTNSWNSSAYEGNVAKAVLVPGMYTADDYYIRVAQTNCGSSSSESCRLEDVRVYDCRTGNIMAYYKYKDGSYRTETYNGSWARSSC